MTAEMLATLRARLIRQHRGFGACSEVAVIPTRPGSTKGRKRDYCTGGVKEIRRGKNAIE